MSNDRTCAHASTTCCPGCCRCEPAEKPLVPTWLIVLVITGLLLAALLPGVE